MPCRSLLALLALLIAAPASAAPWDGDRWQEFGAARYPLSEVPGAFSVTWAPGVTASRDEFAPMLGPDVLRVEPGTIQLQSSSLTSVLQREPNR